MCLLSCWVSRRIIPTEFQLISLAAWFGSLVNGPLADKLGRKKNMIVAVVIFVAGSAVQAGAVNIAMLFVSDHHVPKKI